VTTALGANATSESPTSSSSYFAESTTDDAGAAENGRPLWWITTTNIAIRGLLCSNCNRGLGLLGDDLEGVLRAVEYLRRYEVRKALTR
jgi:hypothetical protein